MTVIPESGAGMGCIEQRVMSNEQCRGGVRSTIVVWESALAPFENASKSFANLSVPTTSTADILLPKCPVSTDDGR